MASPAMSIHTCSRNGNAESVNTYINISPVAILLLVRWYLIQAETIDTIIIIFFTKILTRCQNLSFKLV